MPASPGSPRPLPQPIPKRYCADINCLPYGAAPRAPTMSGFAGTIKDPPSCSSRILQTQRLWATPPGSGGKQHYPRTTNRVTRQITPVASPTLNQGRTQIGNFNGSCSYPSKVSIRPRLSSPEEPTERHDDGAGLPPGVGIGTSGLRRCQSFTHALRFLAVTGGYKIHLIHGLPADIWS